MGIGRRITNNDDDEVRVSNQNKEKEEVFVPEVPKFGFDDMILPSHVKEQILNVADYAKNSKIVFED